MFMPDPQKVPGPLWEIIVISEIGKQPLCPGAIQLSYIYVWRGMAKLILASSSSEPLVFLPRQALGCRHESPQERSEFES